MYDGYPEARAAGVGAPLLDEVWVLSIPAYTRVRLDAKHKTTRAGHTCHLIGQRQMLSIGGNDVSQTESWSTPDYVNLNGLRTFDLSQ